MVSADGLTVTDMITGLVWQREGSGARPGCSGTSQLTCSWSEAQTYCAGLTLSGLSDWRLPALKELSTIVEPNLPSIDPTAFPGTPETTFWTSTQQDQLPTPIVSVVDFDGGSCGVITEPPALAIALGLQFDYHVRCVVGSRCYPTSRFVVLAGGLAQDTLTGLVWQQDGIGHARRVQREWQSDMHVGRGSGLLHGTGVGLPASHGKGATLHRGLHGGLGAANQPRPSSDADQPYRVPEHPGRRVLDVFADC